METPEPDGPATDELPKIEDGMSAEDWYKVLKTTIENQNKYAKETLTDLGRSQGFDAVVMFYLGIIYVRLGNLIQLLGKQFSRTDLQG